MQKISVDLGDKKYEIFIDSNLLEKIPRMIKEKFSHSKYLIVTDENVSELYLNELEQYFIKLDMKVIHHVIPAGEMSKSIFELEKIYDALAINNLTRNDAIIAFGGGVVGDLSGFAASTYLRGVDFIQIPTTLLAQVDSSVGGKVAINLKHGKNLAGNFYQPKAVYIDIDILNTLPEREFKSGLAEIIKYACIGDERLFNLLFSYKDNSAFKRDLTKIIKKCLEIKVKYVVEDEKESHLRMHLNFGHTVGHGIEMYFNYIKYNHGEAVSIGMSYILAGATKLGLVDPVVNEKVQNLLKKYNMPISCDINDTHRLMSYIKNDKKSEGDFINIVLLNKIGDSYIYKIGMEKFEKLILEII